MAAVENISGLSLGTGIEYSWTVQQLGESNEVPLDRYFYDFQTKLVYYKDADGVIISIFDQTRVHYSETSGSLNSKTNYLVKRTVVTGLKATFEILVTTDGLNDIFIPDVIPINFLGKTYFKLNRYTSMIRRCVKYNTHLPRTGTFSAVDGEMPSASNSGIGTYASAVGVGTLFLSEFKVGDRLSDGTGTDTGTGVYGFIASIQSDTQLTFSAYNLNGAGNVGGTGGNAHCMHRVEQQGFTKVRFNDLINSHSTDFNNATTFDIRGETPGQVQQLEGSLGGFTDDDGFDELLHIMPKNDTTLSDTIEYSSNYAPKNLTLSALNMDYLATEKMNGTALTYGSSEGDFQIVLEGYML